MGIAACRRRRIVVGSSMRSKSAYTNHKNYFFESKVLEGKKFMDKLKYICDSMHLSVINTI